MQNQETGFISWPWSEVDSLPEQKRSEFWGGSNESHNNWEVDANVRETRYHAFESAGSYMCRPSWTVKGCIISAQSDRPVRFHSTSPPNFCESLNHKALSFTVLFLARVAGISAWSNRAVLALHDTLAFAKVAWWSLLASAEYLCTSPRARRIARRM